MPARVEVKLKTGLEKASGPSSKVSSSPLPSSPFSPLLSFQFADQEGQVAHLELGQIECQLKATLEVLRERSLQCEALKDTVENLK